MNENSQKMTKAFNLSFHVPIQNDIEKIKSTFEQVLTNPLLYTTIRIKKIAMYHNEYNYEKNVIIYDHKHGPGLMKYIEIAQPGTYTIFTVYSPTKVEIKREVQKELENEFYSIQFRDFLNEYLLKDMYFIYIKHSEDELE